MDKLKYLLIALISILVFATAQPVLANSEPSIGVLPNRQVASGEKVRIRANVSDLDADSLAFYWTQESGPAIQFRGVNTDTLVFTAPHVENETAYIFKLTVSDGQSNSEVEVKVIVEPKQISIPVADAGNLQDVFEYDLVTLDASASEDADSLGLTFHWTQIAGPQVQFAPTQEKSTFFAPQVASPTVLTFQVEVSDGDQKSTDTVSITVRPQSNKQAQTASPQVTTPPPATNTETIDTAVVETPVLLFVDAPTTAKAGERISLKSSVQDPAVTYFWRIANYPLLVDDSYAQVANLEIPSDFGVGKEIMVELTMYTGQEAVKKQHAILVVGNTVIANVSSPPAPAIPVTPLAAEAPHPIVTTDSESVISSSLSAVISNTEPETLSQLTPKATVTPGLEASVLASDGNLTIKSIITAILIATGAFCVLYALVSRKRNALAEITTYDQRK